VGLIVAIFASVLGSAQEHGYTYGAQNGRLYRLTLPSGNPEPIDGTGGQYAGIQVLASSKTGELYGLSQSPAELFLVDTDSGELTNRGPIAVGPDQTASGLAFDANGRLLLLANGHPQSALYEVDPTDASTSFVMWINSNDAVRIAISGTTCYVLGWLGKLHRVDLSTGDVVDLPGSSGWWVQDVSFDRLGQLWGIESPVDPHFGCIYKHIVRFDLVNGGHVQVAQLPADDDTCMFPLAIRPDQVFPVPADNRAGLALMAILIAGVGFIALIGRKGYLG